MNTVLTHLANYNRECTVDSRLSMYMYMFIAGYYPMQSIIGRGEDFCIECVAFNSRSRSFVDAAADAD